MRLSMDGKRVEDVEIRCMGATLSNAFRCDSLKSNGECIQGSADDGPKAPLFRHSHQLHQTKIGHIRLTLHVSLSLYRHIRQMNQNGGDPDFALRM
ncbi:hypothetical protein BDE02_11G093000 [Populus trichocarpa]|nr:hypothetical protein BDE02_11G093000 [Populus trichocarpa]